jgi:hypothetical protein
MDLRHRFRNAGSSRDIGELGMKHIESDPHGSPMAPTNEHPRNLGEVYLPVLSSVLSMETVVGKLWTRKCDRDPEWRI